MAHTGPGAPKLDWRISSFCDSSTCVAVATTDEAVYLRNNSDDSGPVVAYTHAEWDAFIKGAKSGEFDLV